MFQSFHNPQGKILLLGLAIWLTYRVVQAIHTEEIHFTPKYSFTVIYYEKAKNPYKYWWHLSWQAIGAIAAWLMVILLTFKVI